MAKLGFDKSKKITESFSRERLLFSTLDEINQDETGQLRFIEGLNGPIAFSSSKGYRYKSFNEDLQYINTWSNFFVSIDGMGGMGKEGDGKKAALIFAQEIKKGLDRGEEISEIHKKAHLQMKEKQIEDGGVCFLAARIKNNFLETFQAGDVRAVIIKKNGKFYETKDECLSYKKNVVYNCLQGNNPGEITYQKFPLDVGDRIVIASDGVWDNFYYAKDSPQKESTAMVVKLIKNENIKAAANMLKNFLRVNMSSSHGKPDNYNFIIYDYLKPPSRHLNLRDAQNIRELILSLDKAKGIQGSQQYYPSEVLKSIIKRFFNGELTEKYLTRSEGLREKVLKLATV